MENISFKRKRKLNSIDTKMPIKGFELSKDLKVSDLIKNYQEGIQKLYQLPAPELLLDIHKTKIAYLSAELTLLEKMNDFKNDPMSAILAGQNLLQLEKAYPKQFGNQMIEILHSLTSKPQ